MKAVSAMNRQWGPAVDRNRARIRVAFAALMITASVPACVQVFVGAVTLWDWLLAVLTMATFLYMTFLVADGYAMTRDPLLMWLFVALFFWPLVSAGISFYLMQDLMPGKFGHRFRMGGSGDFVSAVNLLELMDEIGVARASLVLMLCTNVTFLVPVVMMYRRVRRLGRLVVPRASEDGPEAPVP